jgi:hypothetical protein
VGGPPVIACPKCGETVSVEAVWTAKVTVEFMDGRPIYVTLGPVAANAPRWVHCRGCGHGPEAVEADGTFSAAAQAAVRDIGYGPDRTLYDAHVGGPT